MQKRIDGIMQSQNLSEQAAKAEIVANSCMTVFDEKFITDFAKAHTKEARTIKDWFNRLVARIRQAMDKVKKYVTEYRAISDDVAEVERIRDLFNAALDEKNAIVKQNNSKEAADSKSSVENSRKIRLDTFDLRDYNEIHIDSKSEYALIASAIKQKDINNTPHLVIDSVFVNDKYYMYYYDVDDNFHIVKEATSKTLKNKEYDEYDRNTNSLRKDVKNIQDRLSNGGYGSGTFENRKSANRNDELVSRKIRQEYSNNKAGYSESGADTNSRGELKYSTKNSDIQSEDVISEFKNEIRLAKLYAYDGIEWFEKSKELYQKYQSGTANNNNFYIDTLADFESVKSRPKRSPDYVSHYFDKNGSYRVSSEYWYYDNYVVRGSNHWGMDIASCDWLLDGKSQKGVKRYGKANWSDFICKTQIKKYNNKEFLTSFENTYGKGQQNSPIYKVNGEYVSYDKWQHNLVKVPDSYVNNTDEFNSNDTELVYSTKQFKNALTSGEWKKYNNAMATGIDAGIRISDNSILVECENNSQWQYKYVIYDDYSDRNEISDVFAIGKIDNNVEDDVAFQCNEIAVYINDVKELGYDNKSYFKKILRTRLKDTSYILSQYNNKSERYNVIGRGSIENGTNTVEKSNGRGVLTADSRHLKFSVKQPVEETKDLVSHRNALGRTA